jgi:hypothetical protein
LKFFCQKVSWRRMKTIDFNKHKPNVAFRQSVRTVGRGKTTPTQKQLDCSYVELKFGGLAKEWWRSATNRIHSFRMRKNSGSLRVPIFWKSGNEISSPHCHFAEELLLRSQATQ